MCPRNVWGLWAVVSEPTRACLAAGLASILTKALSSRLHRTVQATIIACPFQITNGLSLHAGTPLTS